MVGMVGIVTVVVLGALVYNALPSRMPPDPFTGDEEIHAVEVTITWIDVDMHIDVDWDIGPERHEETGATGELTEIGRIWRAVGTAKAGDKIRLSGFGYFSMEVLVCQIWVDGESVARETKLHQCYTEYRIPR